MDEGIDSLMQRNPQASLLLKAVWQFLPLSHSKEHSRQLRVRWYHHHHHHHHHHHRHHPRFTEWRLGRKNRSIMPKITQLESGRARNSTQTSSHCFLLYNMPPLTMVQKCFLLAQVYPRARLDQNGDSRIPGTVLKTRVKEKIAFFFSFQHDNLNHPNWAALALGIPSPLALRLSFHVGFKIISKHFTIYKA